MNRNDEKTVIDFIRDEVNRTSMSEVARKIGSSVTYIHHVYHGTTTSISTDKLSALINVYPELRHKLNAVPDCFVVGDNNIVNYKGKLITNVEEKILTCLHRMKQLMSNREITQETGIGESILNSIFNKTNYKLSKSSIILAIRNSQSIRKALGIDEPVQNQTLILSPNSVHVSEGGTFYNGSPVGNSSSNVTVEKVIAELKSQLLPKIMALKIDDASKLEMLKLLADDTLVDNIKNSL